MKRATQKNYPYEITTNNEQHVTVKKGYIGT